MDISVFLAKFWGWFMIVFCLIYLLRKSALEDIMSLTENKTFTLLGGYLAFILGLATVLSHNIWSGNWRVVVTIFGWISLFKGIVYIAFPEMMRKKISFCKNRPIVMYILLLAAIALGVWFLWVSC